VWVLIVVQTTQERLIRFELRGRLQHAQSTDFSCVSRDDETTSVAENIASEIVPARAGENRSTVISDELSADTDNVDSVPKNASIHNKFDDQRREMVTYRYCSQSVLTTAMVPMQFLLSAGLHSFESCI
jgi:hypothetical protein